MRTQLVIGSAIVTAVTLGMATPLDAQARWRLAQVTRIGGGDEGLASFNDIRDFQLDAKGQVWMLDFQTQTLRLFAADGTPIKEVARKGRGPGELANSNGFRRAPDGRMMARDHSNNRISFFDAAGTAAGQKAYPSFNYGYRWDAVVDTKGRLHELTSVRRGAEYVEVLIRNAPDFSRADTTDAPSRCTDAPMVHAGIRAKNGFAGIPFMPRKVSGFAASGAVWCGSSGEYRLRRFPFAAAKHDVEVTLDVPRINIPAAARDSAIEGTEKFLARAGGALEPWDKGRVPRDESAMLGFATDEQDRLWVARETLAGPTEFDVWDASGRRIAVVPLGGRLPRFPLIRVTGDRLAIVMTDEDDLPTIVVYRIVR